MVNTSGKRFEVVVCSMDSDEASFRGSFPSDAPWLAIPWNSPERTNVQKKFKPPGVPTLTILKLSGDIIALEGDAEIGGGAPTFEKWMASV